MLVPDLRNQQLPGSEHAGLLYEGFTIHRHTASMFASLKEEFTVWEGCFTPLSYIASGFSTDFAAMSCAGGPGDGAALATGPSPSTTKVVLGGSCGVTCPRIPWRTLA